LNRWVPAGDGRGGSSSAFQAVWINRLAEQREALTTAELPDLSRLAGTLDELVPA
jgi:hypothetical protein